MHYLSIATQPTLPTATLFLKEEIITDHNASYKNVTTTKNDHFETL